MLQLRSCRLVVGLVGLVGVLAVLAGCARERAGIVEVTIEDPERHWHDGGFVRMEPPVHLPSSLPEAATVEVWLRLPDEGRITAARGDDGVARLAFPAGTVADRVEYAGRGDARRVVDVRGATIDDEGRCRWHVLRPHAGELAGVQWPCDDPGSQRAATDAMIELLRERGRERELVGFAAKNDCGGCHTRSRTDATTLGEHGIVHRGTDMNGLFVPQTVLAETAPIEAYGAFDANAADPAISVDCGGAALEREPGSRLHCEGGRVPRARLDLEIARVRDPARVDRICAARANLVAHMDDTAHELFASALRSCDDRSSRAR